MENVISSRADLHLSRKLWHFVWGLIVLLPLKLEIVDPKLWGGLWLLVAGAGFYSDFLRLKSPRYNKQVIQKMGQFMRKSEVNGFSGLPFYTLGVGFSLIIAPPEISILAISYLVFADPAAAVVGHYLGQNKIIPHKSYAGILACFLVSLLLGIYLWPVLDWRPILLGASLCTLFEISSTFNIDDNLLIPIGTSLGLMLFF